MEQRSHEWFAARAGRVTASMVGGILGLAPYQTRADVMRRMVRDALGAPPEFTGNIATEYGARNEAGAKAEYMMLTGNKVEEVGFIPFEDWAGCSPDGLVDGLVDVGGDLGGLEIKCPFSLRDDAKTFKPLSDQMHYYAQIQFSMACTGRAWWHFFQWSPKSYDLAPTVAVDPAWQAENMPRLRQFHAEFLHESTNNAEQHLAPRRAEIDTPQATMMVKEYDDLAEAIERAEERKKELLADMVRLSGDKSVIFSGRNLTRVERAGAVSYAKAIAKYAPQADMEPFRGKPSTYWQLK